MKIINDFEQGSAEWHEYRHGLIGGSSAKGLLVKDLLNSALFYQLLGEKTEDYIHEESFFNAAMQRGNELEPFAREEIENIKGIKLFNYGWLQSEECALLGISPDGLTECETIAAEIKCPGSKKYAEYLTNQSLLVDDHYPQVANYFAVNPKLQLLYMVAYRPENKIKRMIVVDVTRDYIVNSGTEKTPKYESVNAVSAKILNNAIALENALKATIEELEF